MDYSYSSKFTRMQKLAGLIVENKQEDKLKTISSNLKENKIMKKQIISEEFLHMQKLASLITEAEYKQKLKEKQNTSTTVGELLNKIKSAPNNAVISLNYDGPQGTGVRALNYVDMEGLDALASGESEIILVGETDADHMTVGKLKSQLSKLDPSTYVTLNLDLEDGTEVVNNIEVDMEGLDALASGESEIILYGS